MVGVGGGPVWWCQLTGVVETGEDLTAVHWTTAHVERVMGFEPTTFCLGTSLALTVWGHSYGLTLFVSSYQVVPSPKTESTGARVEPGGLLGPLGASDGLVWVEFYRRGPGS